MADNDAPGAWPIWTLGTRLAGFVLKRTTIHCYTQNMKALGLVVLEKKAMEANDLQGGAFLAHLSR